MKTSLGAANPSHADPPAKVALTAQETLNAEGVVLLVQGGPQHGNTAVLCDPRDSAWVIAVLRDAIAKLEAASQQVAANPDPKQVQH